MRVSLSELSELSELGELGEQTTPLIMSGANPLHQPLATNGHTKDHAEIPFEGMRTVVGWWYGGGW